MQKPKLHPREAARQAALESAALLDTGPEQAFDDATLLASEICGTPIALVSLVDKDRQWFKSRRGLAAPETPRDISFCGHAIHGTDVFMVPDASADPRFADNPLVTENPEIRLYAGAPIYGGGDLPLGTLCVIDRAPRQLSSGQVEALRVLARRVDETIELRRKNGELKEALEALKLVSGILPMCAGCKNMREGEQWIPLDEYIAEHADVQISHGICPSCVERLYPDLA